MSTVQARVLEEMCFKASTLVDKILSGFCLFLWLARARFSDAMLSTNVVLDVDPRYPLEGFIELQGSTIKTGTSAIKKSMLLPMVAPNRGLGDKDMAFAIVRLRVWEPQGSRLFNQGRTSQGTGSQGLG